MACPANISDDYQVILIGAASVGKTCIIKKWTLNEVSIRDIPPAYMFVGTYPDISFVMIKDHEMIRSVLYAVMISDRIDLNFVVFSVLRRVHPYQIQQGPQAD